MSFWVLEWPRLGLKARPYPDYNLARNEGEQVGVNDVPVVEPKKWKILHRDSQFQGHLKL